MCFRHPNLLALGSTNVKRDSWTLQVNDARPQFVFYYGVSKITAIITAMAKITLNKEKDTASVLVLNNLQITGVSYIS